MTTKAQRRHPNILTNPPLAALLWAASLHNSEGMGLKRPPPQAKGTKLKRLDWVAATPNYHSANTVEKAEFFAKQKVVTSSSIQDLRLTPLIVSRRRFHRNALSIVNIPTVSD